MFITRAVKIYYRSSDGKISASRSGLNLLEYVPVKLWLSFEGRVNKSSGLIVNVSHIKKMVRAYLETHDVYCTSIYDILSWAGRSFVSIFDNCTLSKVKLEYDDNNYSVLTGSLNMITITRIYELAAAHRLWNDQWDSEKNFQEFGKCANPNGHGHNYTLEVSVRCDKDDINSYGLEVDQLDALVEMHVIDKLDHKNLCLDIPEMKGMVPTVENMVVVVWEMLEDKIINGKLSNLRIWETQNTYADYSGS